MGCQNDKRRVETSGGATGVGGTNLGMPQQRSLRKRMVPAARCYNNTPSTAFYEEYFGPNCEKLVDAIKAYRQHNGSHKKDEHYLAELLK